MKKYSVGLLLILSLSACAPKQSLGAVLDNMGKSLGSFFDDIGTFFFSILLIYFIFYALIVILQVASFVTNAKKLKRLEIEGGGDTTSLSESDLNFFEKASFKKFIIQDRILLVLIMFSMVITVFGFIYLLSNNALWLTIMCITSIITTISTILEIRILKRLSQYKITETKKIESKIDINDLEKRLLYTQLKLISTQKDGEKIKIEMKYKKIYPIMVTVSILSHKGDVYTYSITRQYIHLHLISRGGIYGSFKHFLREVFNYK